MIKKLLLIGAGGHCRSIIDSIDMGAYADVVILDAVNPVRNMINGVPIIGTDDDACDLFEQGYTQAVITVGSVGDSSLRKMLYQRYKAIGFGFPSIIDPTAIISKKAIINEGVYAGKGVIVNTDTRLGTCCIANTGAIIEHDCDIGCFVHIGPGVNLSGRVSIGNHSHIGIGSSIIQSINIGENTVIGAGSVVINDIPANVVAAGVPCRQIKSNEGYT